MHISALPTLSLAHLRRRRPGAQLPFPFSNPHARYFYVARNGIYHLFRALNLRDGEAVLVPDFHSGNEVNAIRAAGARLRYYPIRCNFKLDFEALEQAYTPDVRVLYLVHIAGWAQPMQPLLDFARDRGLIVVEDCALSLLGCYQSRPLGSFGDYSVYCLYKSLPVPNGGMLVESRTPLLDRLAGIQLQAPDRLSVASRSIEVALESFRARYPRFGGWLAAVKARTGRALSAADLERVPVGDIGFDLTRVNLAMSSFCHALIQRLDYQMIFERRRANFLYLLGLLDGKVNLLPLPFDDGVCPLYFPVLVEDKRGVVEELLRRGIGAIEVWNTGDPEAGHCGAGEADFLRRHLIELPIHQDVTPAQLEYIAREAARQAPFSDRLQATLEAFGALAPSAA